MLWSCSQLDVDWLLDESAVDRLEDDVTIDQRASTVYTLSKAAGPAGKRGGARVGVNVFGVQADL